MRLSLRAMRMTAGLAVMGGTCCAGAGVAQARPVPPGPGGPPSGNQCIGIGVSSAYHHIVPSKFAPGLAAAFNLVLTLHNNCGRPAAAAQWGVSLTGTCNLPNMSKILDGPVKVGTVPVIATGKVAAPLNQGFEAACVQVTNGRATASAPPGFLNVFAKVEARLPNGTATFDETGTTIKMPGVPFG